MPEQSGSKRTKTGKAKVIVVAVLALAAFVAVKTGWMGFGWAQLKSKTFPRDEALLAWVPPDTQAVAIVDPHQLDLKALGAEQGTARAALERVRKDIKSATNIDLVFDVDKLVMTPNLVIARGRFDGEKLASKLAEYRYVKGEHNSQRYLARAGEDAIAVIDDEILLYGDEPSIKAAIDARSGDSLEKNEKFTQRLSLMGWDRPLLVTVQLSDDRPSLRSMLTGATGPRAVTVGVRTERGLDVKADIEAASPTAADELAKLLEEKRVGAAEYFGGTLGAELSPPLAEVAKGATIKTAPPTNLVKIQAHVSQETLDRSITAAGKSTSLGEFYKTLRLFQLLAPSH